MEHRSMTHITVPVVLYFISLMTILFASLQLVQIPLGALPEENARIATAPVSHFAHVLGGIAFGLIGPI